MKKSESSKVVWWKGPPHLSLSPKELTQLFDFIDCFPFLKSAKVKKTRAYLCSSAAKSQSMSSSGFGVKGKKGSHSVVKEESLYEISYSLDSLFFVKWNSDGLILFR